ncbi:MAG: AAA family ATPase [Colwellia sp.]|nr:AAA family ATPase [Colwellia sp.]
MLEYESSVGFGVLVNIHGHWSYIPAARPQESVPLGRECTAGLFGDYQRQLDDPDVESVFRRGYMLHGPPGTGKTNTAMLFASRFKLDLYILGRDDLYMSPMEVLHQIVSSQRDRTNFVVLFEDIDMDDSDTTSSATTANDDDDDDDDARRKREMRRKNNLMRRNVNISALLNILGGAMAIQGMIAIFNTNNLAYYQKYPALMRAGRIDSVIKVDYAEEHQIRAILEGSGLAYIADELMAHQGRQDATVADYIHAVEQLHGDSVKSAGELIDLIESESEKRAANT